MRRFATSLRRLLDRAWVLATGAAIAVIAAVTLAVSLPDALRASERAGRVTELEARLAEVRAGSSGERLELVDMLVEVEREDVRARELGDESADAKKRVGKAKKKLAKLRDEVTALGG